MEMTLTVHLPRRRPRPVDVVVEWSARCTAADLCTALAEHLGEPVPGLSARGRPRAPGRGRRDAAAPARRVRRGVRRRGVERPTRRRRPVLRDARPRRRRRAGCRPAPPAVTARCRRRSRPDGRPGRHRRLTEPRPPLRRRGAGWRHRRGPWLHQRRHGRRRAGRRRGHGRRHVDGGHRLDHPARATGRRCRAPRAAPGGRHRPGQPPGGGATERRRRRDQLHPRRHRNGTARGSRGSPLSHRCRSRSLLAFFLGPQLLLFAALGPVSLLAGALGDRWGSARSRRREVAAHAAAVERGTHPAGGGAAGERGAARPRSIPTPRPS